MFNCQTVPTGKTLPNQQQGQWGVKPVGEEYDRRRNEGNDPFPQQTEYESGAQNKGGVVVEGFRGIRM
jgi:hypothetical protein